MTSDEWRDLAWGRADKIDRLTRRLSLAEKSIECFEADRVDFEAEVARLRAALREIADHRAAQVSAIGRMARTALEGK